MNKNKNMQLIAENLNDKAYERLKSAVMNNELKPGERLIDGKLAEMLGVSRTPVRDAIMRLTSEGLVKSTSIGRYYVNEMGLEDFAIYYDMRIMCENYAIKKLITDYSEDNIKELFNVLDGFDAEPVTKESAVDVDNRFHETLIKLAKNPLLTKFYTQVSDQMNVYRFLINSGPYYNLTDLKDTNEIHKKIVRAVGDRDIGTAIDLVEKHLELAKIIIKNNFMLKLSEEST
ncbi:MAG: GntR family transcriptional regulator [Eubacteriales bacterium]|nr:GntR family transcriptional regulator [Eubacteriales bacterium]